MKRTLTLAVLSAFALAAAAPGFAQNQGGQSSQDQATPGTSQGATPAVPPPHQKSKKKKHNDESGQSSQTDRSHPGNANQMDVPTTQPGGQGTQSGANPAGPPSSSSSNSGGGNSR
jgi:hypothetical protein